MDFRSIYGHEHIIGHLKAALAEEKVSHAYIFHGEDESGKMMLAQAFAQDILCETQMSDRVDQDSCNRCRSCLQAKSHNHPDIIYVTHEKASIGVDDIRTQLNSDIMIKPYQSERKIYIIDEAEKMTEGAQNALLKTIEEPPEYAVILLLVNNITALLPTILSRCVQLNLRPVAKETITGLLMSKYHTPDYLADISATFSGGNVGKAIQFATSEEFGKMKTTVISLVSKIFDLKVYEIIEKIKELGEEKARIGDYLDLCIMWYRDVLIYKATQSEQGLLFREDIRNIIQQSQSLSYERIETIMKAIDKAKVRLKANVNFDIVMEMMLLTIKENENG